MLKRKKIGLALSGGEAKGLAHIGVLRVLEEHNIPIDFISGTSMGAVIGALYSANPNAKELEKKIKKVQWRKLLDFSIPNYGLIKGDRIETAIKENIKPCKTFKDLRIPLFITAVDIEHGKEVIFNKGDVAKAVRSSISIPEIFVPVATKDGIFVDGGVLDPVPVEILKEVGADIIIAVSVESLDDLKIEKKSIFSKKSEKKIPNIFNLFLKTSSILVNKLSRDILEKEKGIILIHPNLKNIRASQFSKSKKIIEKGKKAAREMMPEIEKAIKPKLL